MRIVGQPAWTVILVLVLLRLCQSFTIQYEDVHRRRLPFKLFSSSSSSKDPFDEVDDDDDYFASPAATYALDPSSAKALKIMKEDLQLSQLQIQQYQDLSDLVVEWNERINLVSRKDCSRSTVFGRHILPSLAPCAIQSPSDETKTTMRNPFITAKTAVDVGTGGGFPGLPLAIAYPEVDFLLLDSVGKKLTAVEDMADRLQLANVQIYHGRAESLLGKTFDVATGRSVSSLPQFSAWMHHLLKKESGSAPASTGTLLYWIGGDLPESVQSLVESDCPLQELIPEMESDKRILVFSAAAVHQMAKESGIVVRQHQQQQPKKSSKTANQSKTKKTVAKGAWKKRDAANKQRGYDDFQRYSSLDASG